MASREALRRLAVILCLVLALASRLWACDTPVFRYALERWVPDPYEMVAFHHGTPPPATGAMADFLSACTLANVRWRPVDSAAPLPADLRELEPSAALPGSIVVRHVRTGETIWAGPVLEQTHRDLIRSPARSAIAAQLQKGVSAVWVLLESGEVGRDDAAAALLESELDVLEGSLVLPVEAPGLTIAFSLIRVARDDPREQVLVRTLVLSEWDLAGRREPMAFPVFGRGRVLYALTEAGITKANIREACVFLTGPCACEIKDDNPGFDLLMAADWTSGLGDLMSAPPLPSVAGLAAVAGPGRPIACDTMAAAVGGDAPQTYSTGLVYGTGLVLALGIAGSLAVTAVLYRRRR